MEQVSKKNKEIKTKDNKKHEKQKTKTTKKQNKQIEV